MFMVPMRDTYDPDLVVVVKIGPVGSVHLPEKGVENKVAILALNEDIGPA